MCQSYSPPGDVTSLQVRSGSWSSWLLLLWSWQCSLKSSQGPRLEKQQLLAFSVGRSARREAWGSRKPVTENMGIPELPPKVPRVLRVPALLGTAGMAMKPQPCSIHGAGLLWAGHLGFSEPEML